MGTKDLTHEALSKALCENTPLTTEQRGVLLTAIADDKRFQESMAAEIAPYKVAIERLVALLRAAQPHVKAGLYISEHGSKNQADIFAAADLHRDIDKVLSQSIGTRVN